MLEGRVVASVQNRKSKREREGRIEREERERGGE
jgi:hypothetical protein